MKKNKKPKDQSQKQELALIEKSLSRFQHIVPIETVIPYQSNPRDTSAAVEKVMESLLECGWCNSIAIESMKNPVIAAGHTRLQAALKLGLSRVPVQPLDHLPPEKIRLFRILDNEQKQKIYRSTGILYHSGELLYRRIRRKILLFLTC